MNVLSMRINPEFATRCGGIILQVLAIGFIGHIIAKNYSTLLTIDLRNKFFPLLLAVMVGCIGTWLLPMAAWTAVLRAVARKNIPFSTVIWVYSRTMIAKYLPGNVFHYIGRQLLGRRYGWPHVAMVAASSAEILLTVSAACLVTFVSSLIIPLPALTVLPSALFAICMVAGSVSPFLVLRLIRLPIARRILGDRFASLGTLTDWTLAVAFLAYVVFIVASAGLMWLIGSILVSDFSTKSAGLFAAAFSVSFVLGYLTPGAPGGIGIREALIVLLLSPHIGEAPSVAVGIIHRLASMLAEVLYYLGTLIVTPAKA